MNKILSIGIVVFTSLYFCACGSDSDSDSAGKYSMSTLPTTYSLDIPDSIKSNPSSSVSKRENSIIRKDEADGDKSVNCDRMRRDIDNLISNSNSLPWMMVISDAAISQNGISADENPHSVTITLTKELFNTLASIATDDTDVSEIESEIGDSVNATITFSDNGSAPYTNSVKLVTEDGYTTTIYWNNEKTRTKSVDTITENGTTSTFNLEYDDSTKTMKQDWTDTSSTSKIHSTINMQKIGNGAVFFSRYEGDDSYGHFVLLLEGYADDNGGYITKIDTDFNDKYFYTTNESFNGNGLIISDTAYKTIFDSNFASVLSLTGESGYSKTTSITAGEYILINNNNAGNSCINSSGSVTDMTKVIGYAIVANGKIIVMDVGCDLYDDLVNGTLGTAYLFKATVGTSILSSTKFSTTSAGTF